MSDKIISTENLMEYFTSNYAGKLFYFCLKKTGNTHEAEDLAQDISINIITQLRKGNVPINFSPWVWRIARNRYSVWADSKRRKNEMVHSSDIHELHLADAYSLEKEWVHIEEIKLLRRELAFISADHREIIVAYYIDNKSVKEIATSLDLSEGTIKSKLFRSRNILKEGISMTREFGIKSYKPEEIHFAASGSQPSGLPWKAVTRKIPKNILLSASNNPSTLEELAIELGVAVPYMEEEVNLLVEATLLKKIGNKYITDFFITDKASQLSMYTLLKKESKVRSELIDTIVSDSIHDIKKIGIVKDNTTDSELKWWLTIYSIDYYISVLKEYKIEWPIKRSNGETWGFLGFEKCELPKSCTMGHNGNGTDSCMFWTYKISDYDLWDRVGEMKYNETILLGDIIKRKRNLSSLSASELEIWKSIDNRFASTDKEGEIIPHILVTNKEKLNQIEDILKTHPLSSAIIKHISEEFNGIVDILKINSNKILHQQLSYVASMQILGIRMMTIYDLVENGQLIVPNDTQNSTIAMWLVLD